MFPQFEYNNTMRDNDDMTFCRIYIFLHMFIEFHYVDKHNNEMKQAQDLFQKNAKMYQN